MAVWITLIIAVITYAIVALICSTVESIAKIKSNNNPLNKLLSGSNKEEK